MKINNILLIGLTVFIVSGFVYDKVLLKAENDKIDRSIQFGDYTNVDSNINFNHVVVNGGNYSARVEFHQRNRKALRYKDDMSNHFLRAIKNDTLYINFKKQFTQTFFKTWSNNKVIVLFDSLKSVTSTNAQNYIFCKKLSQLKLTAKKNSFIKFSLNKVDSLKINSFGQSEIMSVASKAHHLKVNAQDSSKVYLKILTHSKNDITKSEKAKLKIKIW